MNDEPPYRPDPEFVNPETHPSFEGMPYAALRRYVTGASASAERRRIDAWAASAPARRTYLDALGRMLAQAEVDASDAQRLATDTAWTALHSRLEVPAAESIPPFVAPWEMPAVEVDMHRRRPVRLITNVFTARRRWSLVPIAAAALLVAGGAVMMTEAVRRSAVEQKGLGVEREVATGPGRRAEVKLGDGSTVVLASKSRLRFPADFGVQSRELHLEGQAYFAVAHDARRPFTVHTTGSKTIDIGTAFVLRAYPEDDGVQVVVTEGSVAFGRDTAEAVSPSAPIVLTEGWMGQLSKGAVTPSMRPVDPAAYLGWMDDRLIFDDTPLADVAAELGRWYDIEVRFADPSLAQETFSASFTAEALSETLKTLTTVLHLRADRQGKTIVLHRRPQ